MPQLFVIFGKNGDAWHIILGDNPVGHGFVLRNLVQNFRKVFPRGRGGGGGGSHNFEVKIKTT